MKNVSTYDPEREWGREVLMEETKTSLVQTAGYFLLTLAAAIVCIKLDVPTSIVMSLIVIFYVRMELEKETKELRREITTLRKEIAALKAK